MNIVQKRIYGKSLKSKAMLINACAKKAPVTATARAVGWTALLLLIGVPAYFLLLFGFEVGARTQCRHAMPG